MFLQRAVALAVGILFLMCPSVRADLGAHDYSVEITAAVTETPAAIQVSWVADTNATSYAVSRKLLGETNWIAKASVSGTTLTWTDDEVQVGTVYEYQIVKKTTGGYTGYGYLPAAIKRPAVEERGRLILMVEDSLASPLALELLRLEQDLVGDGWIVSRHDVSRTLAVPEVKAIIRSDYESDPEKTKALFLFGNVPAPRSGDISPDVHPDHQGAWPADVYYGNFSGEWTDATVTRTNNYTTVPNVPGDGKFDQSEPPGPVALQIGRVDLSRLTCFANKTPARSEIDLARNYLNKDHQYRLGLMAVKQRGLVYDTGVRGLEPDPQACAAWRSFPGMFGNDQIKTIGANQYLPLLANESYVWSYVRSSGGFDHSDNIATSDDWALNSPKVVFTSFLGSYFGEWDTESDFLRAPLGTSGYTLTVIFSGQPQWILHPMAVGEPIGYSAWLTQNNRTNGVYPPQANVGVGQVHIALMGDPTLRLRTVAAPGRVMGTVGSGIDLSWTASADAQVIGYRVYKSTNTGGPFVRVSGEVEVSGTNFTDVAGRTNDFYMVRALKLEETASGSYFNLSQGVFYPDTVAGDGGAPAAPEQLTAIKFVSGGPVLEWVERSYGVRGFEVQRRLYPGGEFQTIGQARAADLNYIDSTAPAALVAYRVRALGTDGDSDFTPEIVVNLQRAAATIQERDLTTSGDWIGKYGSDGYMIPFAGTNYPAYATVAAKNIVPELWSADSPAPSSLLRPDGASRLSEELLNSRFQPIQMQVRFSDALAHRLSIYMVDNLGGFRSGKLEVWDPYSNRMTQALYFNHYTNGQYLNIELRNFSDIYLYAIDSTNVTSVSGLFFSTPTLDAPQITPGSGTFAGETQVAMTAGVGTTIRFTMDGSEPTSASTLYSAPFLLMTNATIAARAFKDGYAPSAVTSVALTNDLRTAVTFLGIDRTTQGDWKTKYGSQGNAVVGLPQSIPGDANLDLGAVTTWTWTDASAEARALNKYHGSAVRVASGFYGADDIAIQLTLYTNVPQQVALYFLDWDATGRAFDITVNDALGGLLTETAIDHFSDGAYVVFAATGKLQIRVHRVAGNNAIVSGIFFGGSVPVNLFPVQLGIPALQNSDSFSLRLNGSIGETFEIQTSSDLKTWTSVGHKTLDGAAFDFQTEWTTNPGLKVFRAVNAP